MFPNFSPIHCLRKTDLFSFAAVTLAFLSSQLCFSISINFSSLQVNGSYCTIMNFQEKHIHAAQILVSELIFVP